MLRLELQRERWRRARESLALLDPRSDDFCGDTFGLASAPLARLLALPGDPEAEVLDFDPELWAFLEALPDPVSEGPARWGSRTEGYRAAMWLSQGSLGLCRYLALHRNGAIEMGLGFDAAFERPPTTWFRLLTLVGRSWAALDAFGRVVTRYSISGPYQITLGVRGAEGASLTELAEGWDQYWFGATCKEGRFAHVMEIEAWDGNAPERIALGITHLLHGRCRTGLLWAKAGDCPRHESALDAPQMG